jgi:hypothetical protein
MTDLNLLIDPTLNITLSNAWGINSAGQILAQATTGQGYLLTPITTPEPSTFGLLGVGLYLIVAMADRLRRRSA